MGYQHRLKSYHHFIKELQNKIAQSSKQMHSMSVEKDHSWAQCQKLQKQVETLSHRNGELEQGLMISQQDLLKKTETLKALALQNEAEHDSMSRQITFNQETNQSLNDRLNESTQMLQE